MTIVETALQITQTVATANEGVPDATIVRVMIEELEMLLRVVAGDGKGCM